MDMGIVYVSDVDIVVFLKLVLLFWVVCENNKGGVDFDCFGRIVRICGVG